MFGERIPSQDKTKPYGKGFWIFPFLPAWDQNVMAGGAAAIMQTWVQRPHYWGRQNRKQEFEALMILQGFSYSSLGLPIYTVSCMWEKEALSVFKPLFFRFFSSSKPNMMLCRACVIGGTVFKYITFMWTGKPKYWCGSFSHGLESNRQCLCGMCVFINVYTCTHVCIFHIYTHVHM